DNTIILLWPGAMDAGLADILFWGSLAIALAIAFVAAFPVNRALIARAGEHEDEGGNATRVEARVGLGLQMGERLLDRPGIAVDARRDECVVHIADGEDPCRQVKVVGVQSARVAAAVEALMVVEHEASDALVEAAELLEQLAPALGMCLDDRKLVVVERARLLQDRVRNRKLPDVVKQPAHREAAEAGAREAHLLADLNGE